MVALRLNVQAVGGRPSIGSQGFPQMAGSARITARLRVEYLGCKCAGRTADAAIPMTVERRDHACDLHYVSLIPFER